MSEILENEVLEEIPVEETTEEEIIELPPQRVNPFCVISKNTYGEYNVRDIQTNGAWGENPYEDYAVVPDDMVVSILETRGFCDIELNEDGTEVVSFTALEIPEIPVPEPDPTAEERIAELEEQIALADETTIELYEAQIAQDEAIMAQDEAIIELYELYENLQA